MTKDMDIGLTILNFVALIGQSMFYLIVGGAAAIYLAKESGDAKPYFYALLAIVVWLFIRFFKTPITVFKSFKDDGGTE